MLKVQHLEADARLGYCPQPADIFAAALVVYELACGELHLDDYPISDAQVLEDIQSYDNCEVCTQNAPHVAESTCPRI